MRLDPLCLGFWDSLTQFLGQLIVAERPHKLELIILGIKLILNGSSVPGASGYRWLDFSYILMQIQLTFHGLDLLGKVLDRLELLFSLTFQDHIINLA